MWLKSSYLGNANANVDPFNVTVVKNGNGLTIDCEVKAVEASFRKPVSGRKQFASLEFSVKKQRSTLLPNGNQVV